MLARILLSILNNKINEQTLDLNQALFFNKLLVEKNNLGWHKKKKSDLC